MTLITMILVAQSEQKPDCSGSGKRRETGKRKIRQLFQGGKKIRVVAGKESGDMKRFF